MKIRIKSGECPEYLTVGKVYNVTLKESNDCVWIEDDAREEIAVFLKCSSHLNGGSWKIVND